MKKAEWCILVPLVVLSGLAAVAVLVAPARHRTVFVPQYQATVWLRIEPANYPRTDSRTFVARQLELIRNPLVLEPVISQPEIARIREIREEKDPVGWIQRQIQVQSVGGSDLFTLSFSCSNGYDAARVANAVYSQYS